MSDNNITIGIDAVNLRRGGGRTHLIEVLRAVDPNRYDIGLVYVWACKETLELIDDRPWLRKLQDSSIEGNFLSRTIWQTFELSKVAEELSCDVLIVPGGSYAGKFSPIVTISQNLLPFEFSELFRYGVSLATVKLFLLRIIQGYSFRRSDGVIFLSDYAREAVQSVVGNIKDGTIIPHGINPRFFAKPKEQVPISAYSESKPYRILYVSIVDQYKHQWNVVEAVRQLREETNWNIELQLVGPAYKPAEKRLKSVIDKVSDGGRWILYEGEVPFGQLDKVYSSADLGVFASSCENLPMTLLENMASGLPIASSNRGPMPEILRNNGMYFDPLDTQSIKLCLHDLIGNPRKREYCSQGSYLSAGSYSWDKCAADTFRYVVSVLHGPR